MLLTGTIHPLCMCCGTPSLHNGLHTYKHTFLRYLVLHSKRVCVARIITSCSSSHKAMQLLFVVQTKCSCCHPYNTTRFIFFPLDCWKCFYSMWICVWVHQLLSIAKGKARDALTQHKRQPKLYMYKDVHLYDQESILYSLGLWGDWVRWRACVINLFSVVLFLVHAWCSTDSFATDLFLILLTNWDNREKIVNCG